MVHAHPRQHHAASETFHHELPQLYAAAPAERKRQRSAPDVESRKASYMDHLLLLLDVMSSTQRAVRGSAISGGVNSL